MSKRRATPPKQLTINDLMLILGISYPTALNLAKEIGTLDRSFPPNGRWHVDAEKVKAMIEGQLEDNRQKLTTLETIASA